MSVVAVMVNAEVSLKLLINILLKKIFSLIKNNESSEELNELKNLKSKENSIEKRYRFEKKPYNGPLDETKMSNGENLDNFESNENLKDETAGLNEKRYRLYGRNNGNNDNDEHQYYKTLKSRRNSVESDEVEKRYRIQGKRYRLQGKRYRLYGLFKYL